MLAESFDGKTVVVTHHAPSSQSVHPRYANDLLTPAFASNLENLMDGNRAPPFGSKAICMNRMTMRSTAPEWFATHAAMRQMP